MHYELQKQKDKAATAMIIGQSGEFDQMSMAAAPSAM
jgi:hypothetical protein